MKKLILVPPETYSLLIGVTDDCLCEEGNHLFVSEIRLCKDPDSSLRRNCSQGCLYVMPKQGPVIPINQLDALYLIKEIQ